jgi:DNA-binding response OmpR family regulator
MPIRTHDLEGCVGRLLIVDDDPDILRMAEKILAHAGHEVKVAENALKAIDILGTGPFDVLVSDANMPLYSGFELIQTVRANPKYESMAIAMLTGLRERKDVEKALRAGVDDYIVKPLDPLLLVQKVNSLIAGRQPQQKPEIHLQPESPQANGHMFFEIRLESISELGVVIRTPLNLKVGQTVDLQAEFFTHLGQRIPPLKVLSVQPTDKPDINRVELMFLGATEILLTKIRRWIFTHGGSNKTAS